MSAAVCHLSDSEKELLRHEFPGYEPNYGVPEEPTNIDEVSLDYLLLWATKIGVSDIDLMTNQPMAIQKEGKRYLITKRNLMGTDLERIANIFYGGSNGVAHLRSGNEIDGSYSIRNEDDGTSYLFRVNVSSCRATFGAQGIQATIRTIKGRPPTFAELGVEKAIVDAFNPESGLILICGKTGSGKSTLISAGIRTKLENGNREEKILTYESPIEYVYDDVCRFSEMIVQHEVPRHIATFALAVRNSLRRAATDIVIGECREYETISASLEASETGQRLYTTVHAKSVSEALYRILNMFPQNERSTKLFEIIDVLRLIVAQKLVVGVDGKRIALREYLVFDDSIREKLRHVNSLKEAVVCVEKLVEEKGQSMLQSAYVQFNAGRISARIIELLEDGKRNLVDDFDTNF